MLLTTRRLEIISRWATSPATMDIPMASMDIRYLSVPNLPSKLGKVIYQDPAVVQKMQDYVALLAPEEAVASSDTQPWQQELLRQQPLWRC